MSAPTVLVLSATAGLGLAIVIAGLSGRSIFGRRAGGRPLPIPTDRLILRVCLALGAAAGVAMATGWVVGSLVAAVIGFGLPSGAGAKGRHDREIARIEAIASWTEQLRDTLAAANGLEHAVAASARVAPTSIAGAVDRLAARIEYESLASALVPFADELDHPLGDFVVASLRLAAEREARELGALLGQLAECARAEALMRTRVWVGRARTRTTVRVVGIVMLSSVAGLFVLDRRYLAPYDSSAGQIVLLIIAAIFAGSLLGMERMGRIALPARFIGRRFGTGTNLETPR